MLFRVYRSLSGRWILQPMARRQAIGYAWDSPLELPEEPVSISSLSIDPPPSASRKTSILLVEDHPVTRFGLRVVINQQHDLNVIRETDDAPQAMQMVIDDKPDVVVADISLKSSSGIELTQSVVSLAPQTKVLIISMHDETIYAERALRAGALGYLMKQEASSRIVEAIRTILSGEPFITARSRDRILYSLAGRKNPRVTFPTETLSEREMEVFRLLGDGFSTREIADKLSLSTKTIDTYREHLKVKLNLGTGADLVRHAIGWAR